MSSSTEGTDTGRQAPAEGHDTVVVGILGKAHALRGEVELVTGSDEPERLGPPAVFPGPGGSTLTAAGLRRHGDRWMISFEEVADRTAAERLRGFELRIPAGARRELPADEWWPEDLVGLAVVDVDGTSLGMVADLVLGAAQDRLVVDGPSGRFEVPFVTALVPEVDIAAGRVVVDLPPNLP
ncbi:MAG: ribosome maturation factor RimM [Acidimicrobiia bacterium]